MELDAEDGIDLVNYAVAQEQEARLFTQWTAQLSAMALSGSYTSFKDYKDAQTGANIDQRPAAEIMAELDAVEASFKN